MVGGGGGGRATSGKNFSALHRLSSCFLTELIHLFSPSLSRLRFVFVSCLKNGYSSFLMDLEERRLFEIVLNVCLPRNFVDVMFAIAYQPSASWCQSLI